MAIFLDEKCVAGLVTMQDALGALRTGAASGIATKYLANEGAATLGVLGSGRQARTQVEAVSRVRPIREVKVFSPTPEHRERFCRDLEESLKILKWENVFNLADVVSGRVRGRSSPDDITLFKSLGVAIEDVALAVRAYEKAVERKAGQALPDLTG